MNIAAAEEVLDFWFGRPGDDHHLQPRPEWFRKDPAFDAAIRERFGALIEAALRGELAGWAARPRPVTRPIRAQTDWKAAMKG